MLEPLDVTALLSSASMIARKAATYPPETHVVELSELRQIIFELQQHGETETP